MRKWLQGILMIISIVLISISIYSLMGMYGDYHKEHQIHEHLIRLHELDRKPSEKKSNNDDTGDSSEETAVDETEEEIVIDEGLLALHEENPDCIYWIRIPDTQIDYPVLYHPQEKDYYLKKDFYGE